MSENRNRHTMEEVREMAEKYALENLPSSFHEKLTGFSELVGSGKVLDIGCGHGRDVNFFQNNGFEAYGIDPSENMIKYAKKNREGSFQEVEFEDYEGERAPFDGIWCNTVMQFFRPENYPQLLGKMNKLLKTGGILYITFRLYLPRKQDERSYTREGEESVRYRVTEEEAGKALENSSFKIIEEEKAETNDPIISFIAKKE